MKKAKSREYKYLYLKVDVNKDSMETIKKKRISLTDVVRDLISDYKFNDLLELVVELRENELEIDEHLPKKVSMYLTYRDREMSYFAFMLKFANDMVSHKMRYYILSKKLTDLDLILMTLCKKYSELTVKTAMEHCDYARSTISKSLSDLVKEGLLLKVSEPEHGNRNVYSLNIAGLDFMDFSDRSFERRELLKVELDTNEHLIAIQEKIQQNKKSNIE